jgi:hypothetical protein
MKYEAPVLIDVADLAAAARPERMGVCGTGGSTLTLDDDDES